MIRRHRRISENWTTLRCTQQKTPNQEVGTTIILNGLASNKFTWRGGGTTNETKPIFAGFLRPCTLRLSIWRFCRIGIRELSSCLRLHRDPVLPGGAQGRVSTVGKPCGRRTRHIKWGELGWTYTRPQGHGASVYECDETRTLRLPVTSSKLIGRWPIRSSWESWV